MTSKLRLQPTDHELIGRNGVAHRFTGALLGSSTSYSVDHTHAAGQHAPRGAKCSACRWFEVYIYRRARTNGAGPTGNGLVDTPADYVVHTVGGSSVPGERRFSRVEFTSSPFEVIELLTVRPVDRDPFIAAQSARALAQAAELDDGVREAYINRAVV